MSRKLKQGRLYRFGANFCMILSSTLKQKLSIPSLTVVLTFISMAHHTKFNLLDSCKRLFSLGAR